MADLATILQMNRLYGPEEPEEEDEDNGWTCPRCLAQVRRDSRGRICPKCGWYEG